MVQTDDAKSKSQAGEQEGCANRVSARSSAKMSETPNAGDLFAGLMIGAQFSAP